MGNNNNKRIKHSRKQPYFTRRQIIAKAKRGNVNNVESESCDSQRTDSTQVFVETLEDYYLQEHLETSDGLCHDRLSNTLAAKKSGKSESCECLSDDLITDKLIDSYTTVYETTSNFSEGLLQSDLSDSCEYFFTSPAALEQCCSVTAEQRSFSACTVTDSVISASHEKCVATPLSNVEPVKDAQHFGEDVFEMMVDDDLSQHSKDDEKEELNLQVNTASSELSEDSDSFEDRSTGLKIEGRRIVDVSYFLQQLHDKFDNHNKALRCRFSDLKVLKSRDQGLRTQVFFECQMCSCVFNIWTDPDVPNTMGINESAVCGTITAGIGHSTLQEVLAAMAIPAMATNTYIRYRRVLLPTFVNVAREQMEIGAAVEREIAIAKGHVVNGVPYIKVVADGCWAKRTYAGGKYDSLSGAALIFGHESGIILYLGVRNKFCSTCDRAERRNVDPPNHVCYKNWGRDQSSTAMETDIIVEGFKTSIQDNGLIYKTLIADGDSSVYQGIRDLNPYAEYGIIVDKLECNNHLFRNLCRKLRSAATTKLKAVPTKGTLNVGQLRKFVASSGLKIRKKVEHARDIRNTENRSAEEKSSLLCRDILNIFSHVFGDHSNCSTLPFSCDLPEKDINVIAELQITGMYAIVYEAVRYLSCHAKSLLANVTNNMAEGCNSLINKAEGGKRINFTFTDAYEIRTRSGIVQYTNQKVLSNVFENKGCEVPGVVTKLEESRQRENERKSIHARNKDTRSCWKSRGTDKDYGPSAAKPDLEQDVFDVLAQEHMNTLKKHQDNWKEIERETVAQSSSERWHYLRTIILSASHFGPVCRMLPKTSCANTVSRILYPRVINTAATQFGREHEAEARNDLGLLLKKTIVPCGLFIDQEIPYLGASPDGLIEDDGIVEIKCPISADNGDLSQAIQEKPHLRNMFSKNNMDSMNKSHIYYYQVQGQLHITKRSYCHFVLWTSASMKIVTVERDDEFWESKMKPLLCRFYLNCLLPEIVDSRYHRGKPIRDPPYIEKARLEALRKKKSKEVSNATSMKTANESCTESTNREICATTGVIRSTSEVPNTVTTADWVTIDSEDETEVSNHNVQLLDILRKNISSQEVVPLVRSPTSLLTDSSIDLFQNILQENTSFICDPASYSAYYNCIRPCPRDKCDLHIVGGNKSVHWVCLHFDGTTIFVYDSLCRLEYNVLPPEVKRYISKRYPYAHVDDIFVQPVTKQPDAFSCGVYATAFATSIALQEDPSARTYSRDAIKMREHLVKILLSRRLTSFPSE